MSDEVLAKAAAIVAENRNGEIGRAADRVDGWAKVTGLARYSAEITEEGPPLFGVLAVSPASAGVIRSVDVGAALAVPGVRLAWTHATAPEQAPFGHPPEQSVRLATAKPWLVGDRVRFYGDPVALIVAETFEAAREGALAVVADIARDEDARHDLGAHLAEAAPSPSAGANSDRGDFDAAFAAAPIQLDATWTTPVHHHAQMEPHASLARWRDGRLHLFTSAQLLKAAQRSIAETLRIPAADVRIVSRYIGGGFGGKLHVAADAVLAALAARELGRPVKIALSRQQMFHVSSHRAASRQRIRIGADADGRLLAMAHESVLHTAAHHSFTEQTGAQTRRLYATPALRVRHDLVALDIPMADAVRAPGEASGMLALEGAMDELADRLGVDPVELRLRNDSAVDPDDGRPHSSRSLAQCLREGAERFGWATRPAAGARSEDGRLIGTGVAAAIRANYLLGAQAKLALAPDGSATVRQAMTDIGTGSYTILAQLAAEALGVAVECVRVEIGDSDFPPAPGSGGSFGAASAGLAVMAAAVRLRAELARRAVASRDTPYFGADPEQAVFARGRMLMGNVSLALPELMALVAPEGIEADGQHAPPADYDRRSQHAYGAHFAEVSVDPVTGEVRLARMLGVFAAGRLLNARTARSQVLGGMIWGVGSALMEENPIDPRHGGFAAQDLAGYHVPAHADIAGLDAVFLPEDDVGGNALAIKGVGELGICGAGAAVANAVARAIGVRLRHYPLTPDKVLAALEAAGR